MLGVLVELVLLAQHAHLQLVDVEAIGRAAHLQAKIQVYCVDVASPVEPI